MNKYVMVFTIEDDSSSFQVIDWLRYLGFTPLIFNSDKLQSFVQNIELLDFKSSFTIRYENEQIHSSQIVGYWYRRTKPFTYNFYRFLKIDTQLNDFAFQEIRHFYSAFFYILNRMKGINNYNYALNDKFEVLISAQNVELKIPETHIVTTNIQFKNIVNKNNSIYICKPIYNMALLNYDEQRYLQYTFTVEQEHLDNLSSEIFPTLLQQKIEKQAEIRTFYLDKQFYSVAIFSQQSELSSEDYRRYPSQPNRSVCFELDSSTKNKVVALMNDLKLNCGSIDFILDKNDELWFLEVNSVGQFGNVSGTGNYYIEAEIAKYFLA